MRIRLAWAALVFAGTVASPLLLAVPAQADRIRNDQWHLRYLKVAEAHRISQGEGVTVAVPDTGVDPHPDLRENLLSGTDITPGGSGDGRRDRNSHGTAMAGLIAAHGRGDSTGALGIAPKAKILPIATRPAPGEGDSDYLAAGIEYAISHGADVISVSSLAGPTMRMQQAVQAALRADVVVIAAAGNQPPDYGVIFPASYPGVIAVGGVDRIGNRAAVSVTGPELDLVAPATEIYSTSYDGKYYKGTGTSGATAIVAGAAALIRSKYPSLPAEEVAHRLTATAVDKGTPGRDDEYGHGVLDLMAALTADVPRIGFENPPTPPADVSLTPTGADKDSGQSSNWWSDAESSTARGLVVLGVLGAGFGVWAFIARRRRADDPPPRVSR